MTLDEQIASFDKEYRATEAELNSVHEEIKKIFEAKLKEILPIIDHLKKQGFYFLHPDLDKGIYTNVGAIIGRNIRNNYEVFVYDGTPFIKRVDTYNSREKAEDRVLTLSHFFSECDLEFALNGIEYIRTNFERIISVQRNVIEEKKAFLQALKQE